MKRLYLQIFFGFIAMLVLGGAVGSATWFALRDTPEERPLYVGLARVAARVLPPADAPAATAQAVLDDVAAPFKARVTLRSPDGTLLAAVGAAIPPPPPGAGDYGRVRVAGGAPAFLLRLEDGRTLMTRGLHRPPTRGALVFLLATLLALGLGALLLSRRITRRLESLQTRVEALGQGDLSARVQVSGGDEVAKLAASFNRAAAQIERLVGAQRDMLAAASHELRSPLARLSMAISLLEREPRAEVIARARSDIAELDELIDELLIASRLDADVRDRPMADVELLALAAEESARVGAEIGGTPVTLRGDARLLRRLLRNLLDNAKRYAAGSAIEVSVEAIDGAARLRVCDRGPGVAEAERERIFEPFYRPPGTPESGRGVGLGLALVRRIARHHGGDARCLARDGGGACFEVTLRGAST